MNEWMNERKNERTDEWKNEVSNEVLPVAHEDKFGHVFTPELEFTWQ